MVAESLAAPPPEFWLPTLSQTNAYARPTDRVFDLGQRWVTERSRSALVATATYRQALYLDHADGTYYTRTASLTGQPEIISLLSTLPGHYLGFREDYAAGVEYAIGSLYASEIKTGLTYTSTLVLAPGDASTDTGILLSSYGARICPSVLCITWQAHWILNFVNDTIILPGRDSVELNFWSAFLPLVTQPTTQ